MPKGPVSPATAHRSIFLSLPWRPESSGSRQGQKICPRKAQDTEQWTGFKLGREYVKAVYCHHAYLKSMQSTS